MDEFPDAYRFTPYTGEALLADIVRSATPLDPGYENLKKAGFLVPNDALTVVAARANHGLPIFLLNWLVTMLKAAPDKAFVYVSSSDSRKRLALKIVHRESGVNLGSGSDELGNLERYMSFRGLDGLTDEGHVSTAVSDYRKWVETGRIWLADGALYVEDLQPALRDVAKKLPIGAVCVDVFQRVRSRERYPSLDLKHSHVAETLVDVARNLHIPVIVGMIINDEPGDRRELRLSELVATLGLPLNAQVVLGMTNESMNDAAIEGSVPKKGAERIVVTVLKNEGGVVGNRARLLMKRSKLLVTNDDEHSS